MAYNNKNFKSIVICERSRIGRRFLLSQFVQDSETFLNAYDMIGKKIEWCPVKITVCKEEKESHAVFHHKIACSEIPLLQEEFEEYTSSISERIIGIENDSSYIKNAFYMEIHMPPSAMAEDIMEKCGIAKLIVTDSPDTSEKYGYIAAYSASLVMVVIEKDIDSETTISYLKWIDKLNIWRCSGKVGLFYRAGWSCDENSINLQDLIFDIKNRIINELTGVLEVAGILSGELNRLGVLEEDVIKLVKEVISACQYNEPKDTYYKKYDLDDFKKEEHNRVKTKDCNRIFNAVVEARRERLKKILIIAQKYYEEHWSEEWQQLVIQYVVHTLSVYVRKDIGISKGIHPAEAYPPVTMYAMESLFAQELLREVVREQNTGKSKRDIYIEIMSKNGVNNMIDVRVDTISQDAVLKMELTEKWRLDEIKPNYKQEIIGYHYIMGLQKLGEYHIWKEISGIHKMTGKETENYARQKMGIFKCQDCQCRPTNIEDTNNA